MATCDLPRTGQELAPGATTPPFREPPPSRATPDLPPHFTAVEAAARALWMLTKGRHLSVAGYEKTIAMTALTAAAPHLRAQVLAEVDAALRNWEAFDAWMEARPYSAKGRWIVNAACYLADTLGAGGDGEG